ncbi:MAG: hypothetical protein JXR76_10965 [Deltaproteobacteria bacterium]|nr:hypothetical protein [Deltaproteobacteria bacterium]
MYEYVFDQKKNKNVYCNGIDRQRTGIGLFQAIYITRWLGASRETRAG